MAQQNEILDFSGLFKLDVLINIDISTYSFYELGQRKFFAFSSDKELIFLFVNSQQERFDSNYDWDFLDNPIYCMCFEPSGIWTIIVSEQKVLLVPFLPIFEPKNTFDHKWSLSRVTVLPLGNLTKPTCVVCWSTKHSENILIIGSKTGTITFYSLDSESIVGECKGPGEITDLQICYDDSLDLLTLLISVSKSQQCKLVLEHRSYDYNWLQQTRAQNDKDKKEGFMSYIKQLSKDKITFFTQGGSKDDGKVAVEYVLKPTEYIPLFRKGSNNWALTAQYVNGRHFLTAFEVNEGTIILESPEEDTPSRTLRPHIKKDGKYIQGLWSQRLVYLVRKNELEIHSASFSVVQGEALLGAKRDVTELWSAELIGEVKRAHLMSSKDPPPKTGRWKEPTFICDLQLPRFNLEPCLVVTDKGAYVLNTVSDACSWLVGVISRGSSGAAAMSAALGAPLPELLRAAADLLLARNKKLTAAAYYLYELSQSPPDFWVARLGVFGRLQELSKYKPTGNLGSLRDSAITIKLLACLLNTVTGGEQVFDTNAELTVLNTTELAELTSFAAAVGLWDLVPVFSTHRGCPHVLLSALKARKQMCRGAIDCLLKQRCLVPILLEENGQWLFDYMVENCAKFDTTILKCLCLWLNPLQEQLRPVMRDLKQGITSIYTARLQQLITTFLHLISMIEARSPCPEIHLEIQHNTPTWKNQYNPKRVLSCGLKHWAVAEEGNAKIMLTDTPINTEIIGRVVDIACGRHHTLVLTENGIYSAGDNTFGQLGVGSSWSGGIGDSASTSGALQRISYCFPAPILSVAAGHYHSAAIDVGGRLFMWGWGIHGQLCNGTIDDEWSPKLVTKFQGRKVLSVGCGACHTVVLMKNGEVWASGAAVFGQLGNGSRNKATIPIKVPLQDPIVSLAAGYFHNLALTSKGQVYMWGGSPQQVRAASHSQQHDVQDAHLLPTQVDTTDVQGDIVQLSAGWHHSCIMNNFGTVYAWGLNFDGQLGIGDRKQVTVPIEVKIRVDSQPDTVKNSSKTPEVEAKDFNTTAIVACGADYTIYIDNDGRIYAAGRSRLQHHEERESGSNRVIMMKTTKRVISIPSRHINNFLFQPIDRIDIMFPFDIDDLHRKPIETDINPLSCMKDFRKTSWADEIILILKPWTNNEHFKKNCNLAAKYAFHSKNYSECLRLLLDNLKREPQCEQLYTIHTGNIDEDVNAASTTLKKIDELRLTIKNIISNRIREISLSLLNYDPYPIMDPEICKSLPCCCDEITFRNKGVTSKTIDNNIEPASDITLKASEVIDKCMSIFPVDPELWEACFRLSKNFFLENNLPISSLEVVLRKYMESNANTVAAAIMYSNDCAQYSKILSPKFYLNMCSQVLDTWG